MSFTAEVKGRTRARAAHLLALREGHAGRARAHRGHAVLQRAGNLPHRDSHGRAQRGAPDHQAAPRAVPPEDRAHRAPQRAAQDAELPHRGAGTAPSGRRVARHGRALGGGRPGAGHQRRASWRRSAARRPTCAALSWEAASCSDPRGDFHFEVTGGERGSGRGAGGAARPQGHQRARHAKAQLAYGVPKAAPPSSSSWRSPARTRARCPWRTRASSRACATT